MNFKINRYLHLSLRISFRISLRTLVFTICCPFNPPAVSASVPHQLLSETGLYKNILTKEIQPRNQPYNPQYPLWSDGSKKRRWIYLPASHPINTSDMDRWIFPVGTKVWKEFSFLAAEKYSRVETRLMEKTTDNEWEFASYKWNGTETEATLVDDEGAMSVFPIGDGIQHDIPDKNSCLQCHLQQQGDPVLGFSALQLSNDRETPDDTGGLTLQNLMDRNWITQKVQVQPRIYSNTPHGRAAMGYLHVNCGNCHNPDGQSGFSGLYMKHFIQNNDGTQNRGDQADESVFQTAVGKLGGQFAIPGVDTTYLIRPGKPENSSIWYRMNTRTNAQMPNLGTHLTDQEGLRLISDWIKELSPSNAGNQNNSAQWPSQ